MAKELIYNGLNCHVTERLTLGMHNLVSFELLNEDHYRPNASTFECYIFNANTCTPSLILTYLLTPWSRVLLEKLTGFAVNQEIPRILWNPEVHYRTHKRPPTVPILSQPHPIPTTPSHFLKIHFIIIPPNSWCSNGDIRRVAYRGPAVLE